MSDVGESRRPCLADPASPRAPQQRGAPETPPAALQQCPPRSSTQAAQTAPRPDPTPSSRHAIDKSPAGAYRTSLGRIGITDEPTALPATPSTKTPMQRRTGADRARLPLGAELRQGEAVSRPTPRAALLCGASRAALTLDLPRRPPRFAGSAGNRAARPATRGRHNSRGRSLPPLRTLRWRDRIGDDPCLG